jgi:integrase
MREGELYDGLGEEDLDLDQQKVLRVRRQVKRIGRLLFRWAADDQHVKSRSYSETVWKPALVKAGIIAKPVKDRRSRARYVTTRKEGIHQLRHYFASLMLAGGVPIKELAEYLGHADPAFTLRVYAYLLPSSHDRARSVIDDHFGVLRPEQSRNSVPS